MAQIFLALMTCSGLDCNYLLIIVPNTRSGQMTEHEILGFYVDTNRRIFTTFSANNAGLL